jgi:hypothetical protein
MKGIRPSVAIILLSIAVAADSPAQTKNLAYPEEIRFDTIKNVAVSAEKVAETASTFSDMLSLNVAGTVAEEMFTGVLDVIVPKGELTPLQISMEKILAVVLYSAGPEYLILKEIFLYDERRIILIKSMYQAVNVLEDLVLQAGPVLNKSAEILNSTMRRGLGQVADAIGGIGRYLADRRRREREAQLRRYNSTPKAEPSWPYLTFPPDNTVLPQPKDGEWLFMWEEAISTEGICEYEIMIKYRNSRRPIRQKKTPNTYFNFPKEHIPISDDDREFMYWRVRAKNCKGEWGMWSKWGTIHVRSLSRR